MTSTQPSRGQVYLSFALVYLFWGSTYLAMAVAVKHIPAALMTGVRYSVAGPLMLAWCAFRGRKLRVTLAELGHMFAISFLLLTCGNMLIVWTEQFIPSGLASLFVAIVPLYVALVEGVFLRGDRLRGRGWFGLVLGLLGLILLLWPKLQNAGGLGRQQLVACFAVMLGSLCWACGSILSRHTKLTIDPSTATGWEMSMAGVTNLLIAVMLGDFRTVEWARSSLLAIGYLVVFGSWVGFTAYIWLLDHVPTPKVATYAYVNPLVAVLLGFLILHEHLDRFSAMGMVVIIAAVAVITQSKLATARSTPERMLASCESKG
ncbi:MAG TPA: EamA family transporter [Terriglobales bacterium]